MRYGRPGEPEPERVQLVVTMRTVIRVPVGPPDRPYRELPEALAEAARLMPTPYPGSLEVLDVEVVLPAPEHARDGCAMTPG